MQAKAADETRVLVLSNAYPPASMGGYELLCEEHVASLRRHRQHVVVVTARADSTTGEERATGNAGEIVVRALDFHWAAFSHRRPGGMRLLAGERRQRLMLERLMVAERPDVAVVWGMAAVSKSLLAVLHNRGLPVVTVIEEHWPIWDIPGDAWLSIWNRPLRPRALRAARKLVASVVAGPVAPVDVRPALRAMYPVYCSEYMRQAVEEAVPEFRGHGVVSMNGIDGELFHTARLETEPLRRPLRLLYSGRVERRKGVHTAVRALAVLTRRGVDATLTIAGWADEEYSAELANMAREEGVDARVSARKAVDRREVPALYADHDVFLFPTLWPEPFGLAPLEAMACGCVVLATGTGGSGEFLLDDETALLFPPDDPDAVADLVVKLAADPGLVGRLRRAGKATAAAHTFESFAAGVDAAISAALDGAATA